jgi:hypothetical protein
MTNQQQEEQPQERERQQDKEQRNENIVYHTVEPSDSLRWICLKSKVTAPAVGNNLKFAPERLRIPSATTAATTTTVITTGTGTDGIIEEV